MTRIARIVFSAVAFMSFLTPADPDPAWVDPTVEWRVKAAGFSLLFE